MVFRGEDLSSQDEVVGAGPITPLGKHLPCMHEAPVGASAMHKPGRMVHNIPAFTVLTEKPSLARHVCNPSTRSTRRQIKREAGRLSGQTLVS